MSDSVSETAGAAADLKKARGGKNGSASDPIKLDRLPPHALDMEQGVLGCQLISPNECVGEVLEKLRGNVVMAFYDLRHQHIQAEIVDMFNAHTPIDLITVQQRLKDKQLLEQVGGIPYLGQLVDAVPSAANLAYYLDIVREKFLLRRWVALCTEIVGRIYEGETSPDDLVAEISAELFKLCEEHLPPGGQKMMAEVMADVQEEYLDKFRRGVKRHVGPQTGFNYLDNIIPGFGPTDLVFLAARPRTGKSALMMQIAQNIAGPQKTPAGIFSLEMSSRSLGARALFERGGADMTKFLNGFMSDADVQKLVSAQCELAKLPMVFDETPRLAVEDFEVRARRMVRQHKLGILFLDYFQLLYSRNRHRQWNRNDELGYCSNRLKALTRELRVPIFCCAQMNREIEKETHRRPRLSDLRECGQIEQDADIIMFLWKPDVSSDKMMKRIADMLPRMPVPADWKTEANWKKNLALVTCTVEKQREGRSGEDAALMFIKPWTRFVDAYRPPAEEQQPDLGETNPETEEP